MTTVSKEHNGIVITRTYDWFGHLSIMAGFSNTLPISEIMVEDVVAFIQTYSTTFDTDQ